MFQLSIAFYGMCVFAYTKVRCDIANVVYIAFDVNGFVVCLRQMPDRLLLAVAVFFYYFVRSIVVYVLIPILVVVVVIIFGEITIDDHAGLVQRHNNKNIV